MAALTGLRIKYQEAGGKKLINSFEKDLGKGRHCGRTHVHLVTAMTGSKTAGARMCYMNLYAEYAIQFLSQKECKDLDGYKPRVGAYIGETSRKIHERSMEHVSDAKSFSSKSHIVKHWMSACPKKPLFSKMN